MTAVYSPYMWGLLVRLLAVAVLALAAFATSGCGAAGLRVAADVVDQVVEKNNLAVEKLRALQDTARATRKAALLLAAQTATSVEDGHRRMDRVDMAYARVFAALRVAAETQRAVGLALEAAQKALREGEAPSVGEVLSLLADVQAAVLAANMAIQEASAP